MSGSHLSKDFFDLVKSIGESRSKQEEDKIILNEVQALKAKMAAKDVSTKKMKEYLIRMIYVEMLGHDATFGHINGVKMCNNRNLMEKRVGYLSVCLTLHQSHPFMFLLVNTIQNDLKSDNYLEVSMALTVVCKLVSEETRPALLPLVVKLLEHKEGLIKKKAVMALHRFHQIDPQSVLPFNGPIRKALCDPNIAVMGASLALFEDLCQHKPQLYKDLVPDFVSILKQVIDHRLPRDYDYHRMPAPWIQLKLLNVLASLGTADKAASEGMYEVLHEVIKRADIGINVGYAVVYECVRTVTTIYPDQSLLEDAALAISRFITSDNHNLKYLGVTSLAAIVQIDSKYAAEHQMVVVDCLTDSDETLRRKTLDLLYSMTNPANVTVIVDKLLQFLRTTTDEYLRKELVQRISQLAEKFAPSNSWYLVTMNEVFELGGSLVREEMAHNLLKLVAESPNNAVDDPSADIRQYAADTYLGILQSHKPIPDILMRVCAWVLGEFGHLGTTMDAMGVCGVLISCLDKPFDDEALIRSWLLAAIQKLCSTFPTVPPPIVDLIAKYQSSIYVDLQQRAHEFLEMAKTPQLMKSVLPRDVSHVEVSVDPSLSFLNGYVEAAKRKGAKSYLPRHSHDSLSESKSAPEAKANALKFAAYASPLTATAQVDPHGPPFMTPSAPSAASNTAGAAEMETGLKLSGVQKKWGPTGYNESEKPAVQPVQPPPVAAVPFAAQPTVVSMPAEAKLEALSAVPPRKVVKEQPKVLTEKEKLANSLFAGIGATPAAAPAMAVKKPNVVVAAPIPSRPVAAPIVPTQHAAPPPAAKPQTVDIFGSMLGEVAPAPPPSTASTGSKDFDLLQFASPSPAVAPIAAAPNVAKPAASGDLLDLFGSSSAPVKASGPSASPTSFDPFGFAETKSAPAVAPAPSASGLGFLDGLTEISSSSSSVGAGAASAVVQKQLEQFTKTAEVQLTQDDKVHCSSYKAFGGESTIVALFVSNRTAAALANVTISVTIPAGVTFAATGDPVAPTTRPGSIPNQQVIAIPSIPSRSTTTVILSLQVRDPSFVSSPLSIAGTLQSSPSTLAQSFTVPFDLPDFLRPAVMTTAQYGSLWKQYTDEAKVTVRPSLVNTSQEFMSRMGKMQFHPVQTIGMENITAARLAAPAVAGAQGQFVFVHGKVSATGGQVDCIVRSKALTLSQAVGKVLQSVQK